MVKKLILLAPVLSVLLFFGLGTTCFADVAVQLEQAQQLRAQERFGEAEAVYQQIIASAGVSDDGLAAYEKLILMLTREEQLTKARKAYEELMASFSGHEGLAGVFERELGCAFREAGDYRTAVEIYQYLLASEPSSNVELESRSGLFKCYVGFGDDPKAEAELQELLTRFADDERLADVVYDIAYECRSTKKWAKSRELFDYFIERWPGHKGALRAQRGIAKASIKLGDDPNADAAIGKLIEVFANSKGVVHEVKELANDWAESNRYDKAIAIYGQVVEQWPMSDEAMESQAKIAVAYIRAEDEPNAAAATEKLLAEHGHHANLFEEIGRVADAYDGAGNRDEAGRLFQYIAQRWTGTEDALEAQMKLVLTRIRQWALDDAEGELGTLLTVYAEYDELADAVHEIVEEYRNAGAHEEGRELFGWLLENWDGGDLRTLLEFQVGVALQSIKLREWDKAQAAIDKVIADYNDSPRIGKALFQIAEQYYYGHKYQHCIDLLELIESRYPDKEFATRAEVPFVVATCYEKLEEYDRAIEYYQKTFEQFPQGKFSWRAPCLIGVLYRNVIKDYEQAVYWLGQQRELYPDSELDKTALYLTASTYHLHLADYVKAAEAFEEHIAKYPNGMKIWSSYAGLADCYVKLDEPEQALVVLETAYEAAGTDSLRAEFMRRIEAVREGGSQ